MQPYPRILVSVTLPLLAALCAGTCLGAGPAPAAVTAGAQPSIEAPSNLALRKGLDWLKGHQKENGSWSDNDYPALTAFGLWAFAWSDHPDRAAICSNAARFVAGFAQADGGIYKPASGETGRSRTGGLSTYNTAVCMTALQIADARKYAPLILAARKFMAGNQLVGDSPGAGGFGYDRPGKGWGGRPDLSNTAWALHAMRATQEAEDFRTDGTRVDIDWEATVKYVEKLQNRDSDDADNFGGFGYTSDASRGGTATNRAGAVTLRGYGSMTYAGLESMIFAQVDHNDPRVTSALDWATRHWSVDENPGMGAKGLFYYYNIMAKALSLTTTDAIPRSSGDPIPWKRQLIDKLVSIQKEDGSWANSDNQFWEGDPALATAYAVLTMEYAMKETAQGAPSLKALP